MAECTSGRDLTVLVLNNEEARELLSLVDTWADRHPAIEAISDALGG